MSAYLFKTFPLRVIAIMAATLLLLTGCRSSRGSVRRGSTGHATAVGASFDLRDYTKGISDPMAKALITEAQGWLGTRYVYGGDSKAGTDCSGLVMRVYGNVCGLKLPRSTREQVRYCTKVARNKMQPGDLVFFGPDKQDDKVSHVGLYIGEGKMIHASSSRGVMVSGFDSGYWGDRYFTGARIDGAPKAFANVSGGKKSRKGEIAVPVPEIQELPVVPEFPDVPELPVMMPEGGFSPDADPVLAAASAPATTAGSSSQPVVSQSVSSAPSSASSVSPTSAPSTIDLLDLIINQKVDSIFTSQFAD